MEIKHKSIRCETEEESDEFLKFIESIGYLWNSGDKPTGLYEWQERRSETYTLDVYTKGRLTSGDTEDSSITFKEFKRIYIRKRSMRL